MNINYNEEGIPEEGSAIFLHCMNNVTYTCGCIAIPENIMKIVLQKVNANCRIVIDYKNKLKNY